MSDKNSDKGFDLTTKDVVLICVSSAAIHMTSWLCDKMDELGARWFDHFTEHMSGEEHELPQAKKPPALFKVYVLQTNNGVYFGTFSTRVSAEKWRDDLFAGDEESLSRIEIEELEVSP